VLFTSTFNFIVQLRFLPRVNKDIFIYFIFLKQHVTTSKKGQHRRSATKLLIVRASAHSMAALKVVTSHEPIAYQEQASNPTIPVMHTSCVTNTSYIVTQVTYIDVFACESLPQKEQNAIIDSQEQCLSPLINDVNQQTSGLNITQ